MGWKISSNWITSQQPDKAYNIKKWEKSTARTPKNIAPMRDSVRRHRSPCSGVPLDWTPYAYWDWYWPNCPWPCSLVLTQLSTSRQGIRRREAREYDVIWGDSSNHAVTACVQFEQVYKFWWKFPQTILFCQVCTTTKGYIACLSLYPNTYFTS